MTDNNSKPPFELRLISDFWDFYDHAFDREGRAFMRVGGAPGPTRRQMFQMFTEANIATPVHGIVNENVWREDHELVVYTDERAHCGEGKLLMSARDACSQYPEAFCSRYIADFPGESIRELWIGNRCFWIEYKSENWRSNYNCTSIFTKPIPEDFIPGCVLIRPFPHIPLLAIDYVQKQCEYLELLAVDLNTCPGMRGSGVEQYIKPQEVVDAIKSYLISPLFLRATQRVP